MCWTTRLSKYKDKHVAKKDITCYKVLVGLKSPFLGKIYTIGEINPILELKPIEVEDKISHEFFEENIYEGYHSVLDYNAACMLRSAVMIPCQTEHENAGVSIYTCIIPKGSIYYINEHSDIVSNTIIILNDYDTEWILS